MLKSESRNSALKLVNLRGAKAPLVSMAVGIALICLSSAAQAQTGSFTLQAQAFSPPAIDPGGVTTSSIAIGTEPGFSGTVSLTCQVTSESGETPPANFCAVSPTVVQPPGGATASIDATGAQPGIYSVTITGTASSGTTQQSLPLLVTIISVSPTFTVSVQTTMSPASVPAGNQASGVINVNPLDGYVSPGYPTQGVTLSCATISPLVTLPPICSFTYPSGMTSLPINASVTPITINISTFGPITTGANIRPRHFYAAWLPFPILALAGVGAAVGGKRSRKAWGIFAVLIMSASLLLIPACNTNSTAPNTITPNGVTPANTYTFTIVGVDANKTVSTNSITSNSPSVTLTVTAPTN